MTNVIVSVNYSSAGCRLIFNGWVTNGSGGLTLANWSGVSNVQDEVKLAVVKTSTNGFTAGDMYYSSGTNIGWLSANGSMSDISWAVLTNQVVTNALPLRGSLYVDQTGIWSNNLIAVTSDSDYSMTNKSVWEVDAQRHPTLVANILTRHLEGVITITNDTGKMGTMGG